MGKIIVTVNGHYLPEILFLGGLFRVYLFLVHKSIFLIIFNLKYDLNTAPTLCLPSYLSIGGSEID